jgi:stage II sporulation protein P
MRLIRLKVVRASSLLLGIVLTLLAVVLAVILVSQLLAPDRAAPSPAATIAPTEAAEANSTGAVAAFAAAAPSQVDVVFGNRLLVEVARVDAKPTEKPRPRATVLIYHTHTNEAFRKAPGDTYRETETWRTDDHNHSVVRVGEVLSDLLADRGFDVTHDVTNHEPPDLATAYERSLNTIDSYPEKFDLYIDLHRDAYTPAVYRTLSVRAGGTDAAQLMLLVGNGKGFDDDPAYFPRNLTFARKLTNKLNQFSPGLCQDVLIKNGRYNQHVGLSILVEAGHNRNTLLEAIASMPYLADAISEAYGANSAG